MADMPINFPPYAVQYSDTAKESRKELPPEVMLALFDVIDKLAENPCLSQLDERNQSRRTHPRV